MLMDKRTLKRICLNWISSVYLHVQNSFLARHGLAGLLYIIVDISKFILCQCFIACSLFFIFGLMAGEPFVRLHESLVANAQRDRMQRT